MAPGSHLSGLMGVTSQTSLSASSPTSSEPPYSCHTLGSDRVPEGGGAGGESWREMPGSERRAEEGVSSSVPLLAPGPRVWDPQPATAGTLCVEEKDPARRDPEALKNPKKKMSRRSSRLQAKQQPQSNQTDSPQETQFLQAKKRKTAQDVKKKKEETVAKRQQYEIRNCWPSVISGGITPCIIIETPHKETVTSDFSRFTNYRFKNLFINPSPLPDLSWGCSKDVWFNMLKKETKYVHDKHFEMLHSDLEPQMRSILLDWLLEVCEVYTLHRETFYLAQDFFDRFMLTQKDINKNMLQLIGITSLFIASKLEEIYAPKLQEFAYVTDGACSEDDILGMELIILKALKWELCPVTVIAWLNVFLQVDALKDVPKVLLPQYSQEKFVQIAQLLDLCILSIDSLEFQYRILAAAALCHFTSIEVVKKASGLDWDNISECVEWMVPFARVVKGGPPVKLKVFKKISVEDRHNIQTHTNYLAMLEEVNYVSAFTKVGQLSPVCNGGIMTPPKSTEKSPGKH
ncbi:G1/S-specific cyclin-E2 isoform X1 [Sarcophilus harrisii]|uniref:Cyclin E2 n=2 Tax=Sarcophilus harrisii TaxID=9305 RepID=A0A7N4NTD7_SARHA|nr:G1/S-specific cyclin-E2 isoform X1 [Sarcophilus harrisii]